MTRSSDSDLDDAGWILDALAEGRDPLVEWAKRYGLGGEATAIGALLRRGAKRGLFGAAPPESPPEETPP